MDLMIHNPNRLHGPIQSAYKTSRCSPALALYTNATPNLHPPILLYHLVLHPFFRVVLSRGTFRLHLPAIRDRVPTLVIAHPPLDEVLKSGIVLPFMKNVAHLQVFLAHLPVFTPGPLQYRPLLPHVRSLTLCLLSHSSRPNLQHPMATRNHLHTCPCRRLRHKLGLHLQPDPLVPRNRLLQPVGIHLRPMLRY